MSALKNKSNEKQLRSFPDLNARIIRSDEVNSKDEYLRRICPKYAPQELRIDRENKMTVLKEQDEVFEIIYDPFPGRLLTSVRMKS